MKRIYRWALYLVMSYESQTWNLMVVEKMYVTLILSNPLRLTIRSSLCLIQNELWVSKCYHTHFKFFSLCLWFPKDVIKILAYYISIIFFIYHIFRWKVVKSGSLVVCFHLHTWCGGKYLHKDATGVNVCPFLLTLEWWLKNFDCLSLMTEIF